jgi:CelD/BcsL family acetyltransferase involved in cellulose biosynthesis
MFTVEWITDVVRLGGLTAGWNALVPRDGHPFDLHDWYAAWWGTFGGEAELAVCTVWRGGELAGVLPLRREGGRLYGLANGHSGMFRPLATDDEAMEALIEAAFSDSSCQVELTMLPAADDALQALERGMRDQRMLVLEEGTFASPIVDTSGDVDAWRKGAKSSWKGRLARYRRKMLRDYDARLDVVTAPDDLEGWLADGFRVEASGWKGEAGTAILSAPETEAFYRDLARRFHARDDLRLSRIVLDGQTVAFSFCILWRSRLYSLKTGFDESWRKIVPGLVLQLSIVERCFELGLDAYELLGETSDWKEKIATESRSYATVRAYRRRPAGVLRYAYRSHLRPRLKSTYRRMRPRER